MAARRERVLSYTYYGRTRLYLLWAYSALARKNAVCAAAAAAATMALNERMPGTSTARVGASSTEPAKERHLMVVFSEERPICDTAYAACDAPCDAPCGA